MVDQVLEGLSLEGHTQPRHIGEVRLTQLTRLVLLRKKDFLGGAFQRPPELDAPLQRAQLDILKLARILALQVLEQGLACSPGLSWRACSISGHTCLKASGRLRQVCGAFTRLGSFPARRYLRAVFSAMSALAAATARVSPL